MFYKAIYFLLLEIALHPPFCYTRTVFTGMFTAASSDITITTPTTTFTKTIYTLAVVHATTIC